MKIYRLETLSRALIFLKKIMENVIVRRFFEALWLSLILILS